MATIQDVADTAGVALSTASLALRNRGKVAKATVERVRKAAIELGYQPNRAAALLASGRKGQMPSGQPFGIAVFHSESGGTNSSLIEGVSREARELGYALDFQPIYKRLEARDLNRAWHSGNAGVILAPSNQGQNMESLDWSRFSVVKIGRVLPKLPAPMVRTSAPELLWLALNSIFERGYRRVLVLLFQSASRLDDDLRIGACYAYRERHLNSGAELAWHEFTYSELFSSSHSAALSAQIEKASPDVVLGFTEGFHDQLLKAGFRIPGDIAYATMPISDMIEAENPSSVPIAGVDPRRGEQGRAAVRQVHQMIQTREQRQSELEQQIIVAPRWLDGASLPIKP